MRLVGTKVLHDACVLFPNAASALRSWKKLMMKCNVANSADLQKIFSYVGTVPPQTVFNICGNDYRLIAKINYGVRVVRVQHVLTHAEYDKNKWEE